jgi:hypothetical protein
MIPTNVNLFIIRLLLVVVVVVLLLGDAVGGLWFFFGCCFEGDVPWIVVWCDDNRGVSL